MFAVAYKATERGILAKASNENNETRQAVLRAQRALYEAKLQEVEHIAEIRRVAAERAEAMAREMRAMGYRYHHTYREIERRACKVFRVTQTEIHSNRRNQSIVIVRQFISYWTRRLTRLSLPQVGRLMGGRDHTTILHHANRYPEKREKMGRYLRRAR